MTTAGMLAGFVAGLALQPAMVLAAIFLATFVLEDAAIVATGLLASRMLVDPWAAGIALTLGVIAGDLALHCLGRWAASLPWVRRQCRRRRTARALDLLERGWWQGLLVARFVPMLRLPVYLASGLLRLRTPAAATVIAIAGLAWAPLLFLASMAGGTVLA
ncbi:VTT domain-containing protein [Sphingomonas sp.]|uniref:DedA family protein n=1 Tax=Sphingomonas sp. TaxID=28214 RepID=UPI001B130328|nr:VTT domain-containing protein [Sphingomonas sp.]MBO9711684.1 VTT domain-containing protein [Sphingomonas sp.]